MKKKIIIIAAALAAAVAVVVLLNVLHEGQTLMKRECELYFLNDSESTLVSEKRILKYHDSYDLPAAVLNGLISGPDNGKNKAVLSRKTKLLAVDLSNPTDVVVDFNYKFLSGDVTKDTLAAYAVVKTLCGLDGIERVKVTVEKNDISDAEGKPIGFLADEDINLSTDTNTSETREITLYFAEKGTNQLVPETRTIKVTDQLPLAQYILNELIHGTQEEGHENVLSPDTILLSVHITDNICFVNFQSNFLSKNAGSEEKERLAVYSVVNSLTALNNIGRVQFLIDGKKVDYFGSIRFDELFEQDMGIIMQKNS